MRFPVFSVRALFARLLFWITRPATPEEQLAARICLARDSVLRITRGRCSGSRIVEAQSRAERSVLRGEAVDVAVRRAAAWATSALPIRSAPEVAA